MNASVPLSLRRKSSARVAAVQCLYRVKLTGETLTADALMEDYLAQWQEDKNGPTRVMSRDALPDKSLLRKLLSGVEANRQAIDDIIKASLNEKWTAERMSPILLAILACAIFELRYGAPLNPAIVINEYVTLTGRFFEAAEVGFVNGILDAMAGARPVRAMHEFDFIATLLAPLAAGGNTSLGLKDDAALLPDAEGRQWVVTKDAMVAGVHFTGSEAPSQIARKLLRVNLSDIAAMGAVPRHYLLSLMLPAATDDAWLKGFAQGLAQDQAEFGVTLLGGDTTASPTLGMSLTLLGLVPEGKALLRSGAKPGDGIYVSGTLGDGSLGLAIAQGWKGTEGNDKVAAEEFLLQRYQLPTPRIALGAALRGIATACMDISDGLLQDLGHICSASGVGAKIEWERVPLSEAARRVQPSVELLRQAALAGGDDYELLFTVPYEKRTAARLLSERLAVPLACIGTIIAGNHVQVLDKKNHEIELTYRGYRHF